jgi:hypothetical protein
MEPSLSGKLLGVAITLLMLISAVLLMRKRLGEALHMLLVGLMVLLPLFFGWVIVPIKSQTDGPLVRFFRDYEGQIGTVAAYDVNPAQVAFYARVQTTVVSPFDLTPLDSVGKYMVAAVPQEKNIDRYFKSFTKIRKEGGWLFYKYTPALSKH